MNVYTQWKKYLETAKPTAVDMAAYAIARSIGSDDALSKALYLLHSGFSPIKKKVRLLNGEDPYSSLANVVGHSSLYEWTLKYSHNRLKSQLKEIFDIDDSEELTEFLNEISKNVNPKYSKPYSYVLVRKDLSHAQRVVQSCHAIQEVTMKNPEAYNNTHMIVLQVENEDHLKAVQDSLRRYNRVIKYHTFFESDNDIGFTAIATSPITNRYLRNFFANFELLN
ncbi:MAG: hypothetical protein M0R77_02815 [Gammaproteobacteria bacterium]|nr:hypothetical protein [Gammaproteobacteria bacterium]